MSDEARLGTTVYRGAVEAEWIDVNNHMNVAYYVLAFDLGVDSLWARFGLDEDFVRQHGSSTFAVECHVTWQRELVAAAPFEITTQVLAYDAKRIHQFMRIYHATEGYLAATAEWMNLHIDLGIRRVAPWPDVVYDRIAQFAHAEDSLVLPDEAGRRMLVAQPDYNVEGYPSREQEPES